MNLKVSIQINNKTATEFHTNSNQNNNKKDENSNPNTFFSNGISIQFNSNRYLKHLKKRVCFQLSSNMCVCFLFRNLSFFFLSSFFCSFPVCGIFVHYKIKVFFWIQKAPTIKNGSKMFFLFSPTDHLWCQNDCWTEPFFVLSYRFQFFKKNPECYWRSLNNNFNCLFVSFTLISL